MCGIVAIFSYKIEAPQVDKDELLRIRDAMISRGPDGKGVWISDNQKIGMAHRRLSIIDLSEAGSQPMASADGLSQIVYNGEIYNYQMLRLELEKKGYQFRSDSDTEVLLNLYSEKGSDMMHDLRGMYAFAIWDEKKKGMFLARDPFGIKPLYIYDDGKTFRCASQVKALVAGGKSEGKIEPAGHVGFFIWGSVPEPYTLYQNIFALPAGHTLWVDSNGSRAPQCYFDVTDEFEKAAVQPVPKIPVRETLREALRDSVRHHLIADVPVGVFLSAGIDSGTITALASQQTPNIKAITLKFEEYSGTKMDEVPLAKALASRYNCNHHISHISRQDFDEDLSRILTDMDQPSIDGVNTWFAARAAAQVGLKVALTGLGGDELLGGYPGFLQIPKLLSYARIPSLLRGFGYIFRTLSAPLLKRITSPKYASLFEYAGTYGSAYLLRRALFMPWELSELLDLDLVREGLETLQPVLRLDAEVERLPTAQAKISVLELTHYMRNTLLRDSDWAGMAHSIEIRTPLVDVDFFRALAPYIFRPQHLPSKKDLALAPINPLPDTVINRPKTGFSIPIQRWIERVGASKKARGLRVWAKKIYEKFGPVDISHGLQRKRILALVSDAFGAKFGIAKFNRDLLTACSASPKVAGVVAVVRILSGRPQSLPIKLLYDARYCVASTHGIYGKLRYINGVIRIVASVRKIDLVICGHINYLPLAFFAARVRRAKLWCILHGTDAWWPHRSPLVNLLIRRTDFVSSVSEYTKQRFMHWARLPQDKVYIFPNSYDPAQYSPGPKPVDLLERYGLNAKIVLMTLGRLAAGEKYKGFDEIMAALPAVAKKIPNIAYLIVGDGDDKIRLKNKAKELGIEDRVVFTGYIPEEEKADHYRLADAYVMPGKGEGFGIVYLEAMACGIPTVGSKLDGSSDVLRNGQLGILANPLNLEDVERAILEALAQERGKVPEGLDFFSLGAYRQRTFQFLNQIFAYREDKR